jgi:hypothetical protein
VIAYAPVFPASPRPDFGAAPADASRSGAAVMWTVGKALLLRWALARSFGGLLAVLLALAVPFAGVLKLIGLPLLFVLLVVGAPVLLVLAVLGLPLLLVVAGGGIIMAVLTGTLLIGLLAFKFLLPVILIVLLLRWIFRRDKGKPTPPTTSTSSTPPYTGPVSPDPTASTIDPLES